MKINLCALNVVYETANQSRFFHRMHFIFYFIYQVCNNELEQPSNIRTHRSLIISLK